MAYGLNKVMVIGYLGRDPEMRFTPNGKPVTCFCVACDRSWKNADGETITETEWFNVITWGKQAETAKNVLKNRSPVYLEGRLHTRTWQDKHGNQQTSIEIIAQEILLLSEMTGRKLENNESEGEEEYPF